MPELVAVTVAPDGRRERIEIEPSLDALKEAVGGWIEAVPNPMGLTVYCNEEGKLEGLEPNPTATSLFGEWLQPGDVIAGTVIALGPIDDEGNDTSLSPKQVANVLFAGTQSTIVKGDQ